MTAPESVKVGLYTFKRSKVESLKPWNGEATIVTTFLSEFWPECALIHVETTNATAQTEVTWTATWRMPHLTITAAKPEPNEALAQVAEMVRGVVDHLLARVTQAVSFAHRSDSGAN